MVYQSIDFKHYQPSRLLVLTHPAWGVNHEDENKILPFWEKYLEDAKIDNQVAILIIDGVTRIYDNPNTEKTVKERVEVYLNWFDKLKKDYVGRIAFWGTRNQDPNIYRGLLRPKEDKFHFDWLHHELNIKPNTIKLPFKIFNRTYSSFYQIDYHGIGLEDSCTWEQNNNLRSLTFIEKEWNLKGYDDKNYLITRTT